MGTLFSALLLIVTFIGLSAWMQSEMGFEPEEIWPLFIIAFFIWLFANLIWILRWPVILAPVTISYWMFAFRGAERSVMFPGLVISGVLFLFLGVPYLLRRRRERKARLAANAKK